MTTLQFRFRAWRRFAAVEDRRVIARFLKEAADESEKTFKAGMRSAKSGKVYHGRSGRSVRASSPGEYPAIDTGELERSIGTTVSTDEFTIGTRKFYAHFLREGTSGMRRRKMSDNAMQEGVVKARKHLMGFVKWRRS